MGGLTIGLKRGTVVLTFLCLRVTLWLIPVPTLTLSDGDLES